MAANEWAVAFRDEETYLAFGRDKDRLPIYKVVGSLKRISILVPTKMNFPGCLCFLPYAEELMPLKQMKNGGATMKYGPLVNREPQPN